MMDLAEEDHVAWTVKAPPLRHTPFEHASSNIGKPTDVVLLQPVEQGLRSELRLRLQPLLYFTPSSLEWIDSRAVVSNRFSLRRQSLVIAVFACAVLTHLRHPCRSGRCSAQLEQSLKFLDVSPLIIATSMSLESYDDDQKSRIREF
jgi:hypothetical protein